MEQRVKAKIHQDLLKRQYKLAFDTLLRWAMMALSVETDCWTLSSLTHICFLPSSGRLPFRIQWSRSWPRLEGKWCTTQRPISSNSFPLTNYPGIRNWKLPSWEWVPTLLWFSNWRSSTTITAIKLTQFTNRLYWCSSNTQFSSKVATIRRNIKCLEGIGRLCW